MKTAKKKTISPTQRTLKELRRLGFVAAITEHWNAWAKIRQDLFGFIDIVALNGANIIAIQCTSGSNHAARRTKILGSEAALLWIKGGGILEVWSWDQQGERGEKKRWVCRKEELVEGDFQ